MDGNEIRPRNAIAVEEDAIRPTACKNAAVANFGGAKAAILLPDVLERNVDTRGAPGHKIARRFVRAVVGDDDLEVTVSLTFEPAQRGAKGVHAIIGRHNDGD